MGNEGLKKYMYISWTESPPSSKAKRLSTQWGVSQGATLFIVAQLHLCMTLHPFVNFWSPLFLTFLLFTLGKNLLNQNDVEFDFSIGHALLLFSFFWIINKKRSSCPCTSPPYPTRNSYISIYFGYKTLFSPNTMIIILGSFRKTSNYMK